MLKLTTCQYDLELQACMWLETYDHQHEDIDETHTCTGFQDNRLVKQEHGIKLQKWIEHGAITSDDIHLGTHRALLLLT